jgi:predicted kinase
MKIIFVIGPQGSGKPSYVQKNYPLSDQVSVFDLSLTSLELFGDYQALEDDEQSSEVYNQSSEKAFFALMDGKDLVVEYPTDGFDEEMFSIINQAKKAGLRTEVIALTVDPEVAWERVQKADSSYYSSGQIKEETIEVLGSVIEDYVFNQDFEKICEIGSEGGSISFFRCQKEGKDVFFFSTEDNSLFEFAPDYAFEKMEGVAYLEEFDNFKDAFEALLEKYPIFRLYPLEVSPNYRSEFKEAYHSFLETEKKENTDENWITFLN